MYSTSACDKLVLWNCMQICINPDHCNDDKEVLSSRALKLWTSHVRLLQGTQAVHKHEAGKNNLIQVCVELCECLAHFFVSAFAECGAVTVG